jgi:Protein of unknown function (DUF2637)
MTPRRLASTSAALVVAGIAAVASYAHMRGLALRYGQEPIIATLLPISVDGMLVVATLALGDGRRYRWSAWLAFWVGVAASVIANVLAAQDSAIARWISAWPAIAFLLVVEVITRAGRGHRPQAGTPVEEAPPVPAPVVIEQVSAPIEPAPPVPPTTPDVAAQPVPKVKTDRQLLAALRDARRVPRDPDGTVPIRRAAKTLGCGPERARKLLDQAGLLRTGDDSETEPAAVLETANA